MYQVNIYIILSIRDNYIIRYVFIIYKYVFFNF